MTDIITFVKKLLHPILAELKMSDYSLNINPGSAKGDGYLGDIYSVKIHNKTDDIDIIVKAATKNPIARKDIPIQILFRNEIDFYTRIFPVLSRLQNEKNVSNPFEIAKYFTGTLNECEEVLILENLKVQGYKIHTRRRLLDELHVILALKAYAKFHALSFALRSKNFEELANLATNVIPLMYPNLINAMKVQMWKCVDILKRNGLIEESKAAERITENAEDILYIIKPDDYSVIVHGDCWSNNIMFQYDVIL